MSEIVPYVVSGEVLPPKATLNELREQANREHHLVEQALGQALDHVIAAGEALTTARENHVAFKGWEAWAEENFDGGHTVASYYMRIFEHRDLVQGLPNVTQAMTRLRGMPALRRPGYRGYSEEVREEARALAGAGMAKAEIGRVLGINPSTITHWLDSKALKRHRARIRIQSAKRRAEVRRQKQEAADRAAEREARRVGGSLAEAYSLVHRLEAPLARAEREATDPEVQQLLDEAVKFQHMTLYRIVSALGAS